MALLIPKNLFGLNRPTPSVAPNTEISKRLIRAYLAAGIGFIRDNGIYGPVDYVQGGGSIGNGNLDRVADWMNELRLSGIFGMVVLLDKLLPRDPADARGIESVIDPEDFRLLRQHCNEVGTSSAFDIKTVNGNQTVNFNSTSMLVTAHGWLTGDVIYLSGFVSGVQGRTGAHFTVTKLDNDDVRLQDTFGWGGGSITVSAGEMVYRTYHNVMDDSRRMILHGALAGDPGEDVVSDVRDYIEAEVQYIRSIMIGDCLAQALNGPELDGWSQTEVQEFTFAKGLSADEEITITLVIGTTEYEADPILWGTDENGPAPSVLENAMNASLPAGSAVTVEKHFTDSSVIYEVKFDNVDGHDLRLDTTAPAPQQIIVAADHASGAVLGVRDVGFVLPGQKLWRYSNQTNYEVDTGGVDALAGTITFTASISSVDENEIFLSGTRIIGSGDKIIAEVRSIVKGYDAQGIPWNFENSDNRDAVNGDLANSFEVSDDNVVRRARIDAYLEQVIRPLWETTCEQRGTFFKRGTHYYRFNNKSILNAPLASLFDASGNWEATGLGDRTDMLVTETGIIPYFHRNTDAAAHNYAEGDDLPFETPGLQYITVGDQLCFPTRGTTKKFRRARVTECDTSGKVKVDRPVRLEPGSPTVYNLSRSIAGDIANMQRLLKSLGFDRIAMHLDGDGRFFTATWGAGALTDTTGLCFPGIETTAVFTDDDACEFASISQNGIFVSVGDIMALFYPDTGANLDDSLRKVIAVDYTTRVVTVDSNFPTPPGVPPPYFIAETNYVAMRDYFNTQISSWGDPFAGVMQREFDQGLLGFLRGRAPTEARDQ